MNTIREQEAVIKALRDKLDAFMHTSQSGPDTSLSAISTSGRGPSGLGSPTLSHPRLSLSPRVQDKDIQDWIDKARESANVSGDLDPGAVSTVDDHERLSTREESDDDADDGVSASEAESLLRPPGEGTTRSPAVGTPLSPIGLIASSALKKKPRRGSTTSAEGETDVGVANESYFRPGGVEGLLHYGVVDLIVQA